MSSFPDAEEKDTELKTTPLRSEVASLMRRLLYQNQINSSLRRLARHTSYWRPTPGASGDTDASEHEVHMRGD